MTDEIHVVCNVCREDLGIERPNWGADHLAKYPNHNSFGDLKVKIE